MWNILTDLSFTNQQKAVDETKISHYAQGTVRKSRREKEKEAAEARKKEEEESAARAYAEFLDAFDGEDVGKRKTGTSFVRASGDSSTKTPYQPSSKDVPETITMTAKAFREEMEEVHKGSLFCHRWLTTFLAISSTCCPQAQRQTCNGCFPRRN